ncbi:MAG: glycine cleavage system protein GcvH [Anaerovoracaceae bacterium]
MKYPKELKYVKSHEWVKEEGDMIVVGISDYAQDALGDIVFVNLPEEGDDVSIGDAFADVESVKAVSDIFSPVEGTVKEVNEELVDNPALINEAPYDAWLIKVENVSEKEDTMDADAYEKFIAEEAEA